MILIYLSQFLIGKLYMNRDKFSIIVWMIDLHTHSNFSDGNLSPDMLINEAFKQGLYAIALTDHDTIKGLEIAKKAAIQLECRQSDNIRKFSFIPGIEISINWTGNKSINGVVRHDVPGLGPGGEFHLLGLGINTPSPAFIVAVDELASRRVKRNRKIFERMVELSMINPDDMESAWKELTLISGGNSLGRPHFAVFLIKHKFVKNIKQAFTHFLGAGKPLYVPKEGIAFEEAVVLIRESGGIPVLAHPLSLFIAWGRLPDLVKSLKEMGLMGLEAWHPIAKSGSCRRLEALGKSLGLYVTEGSDFHGSFRPVSRLGYSNKGRKINDAILEAIPELQNS